MKTINKNRPGISFTRALAGGAAIMLSLSMASTGFGAAFTLDNGPGDGTVVVGVDGYGAFGGSIGANATDAVYNPVGLIPPAAGTSFESGVAIRFGNAGARSFLTSGDIGGSGSLANPTVTGNLTLGDSSFTSGPLRFELQQTLVPLFDNLNNRTGTELRQTYAITNTGAIVSDFELLRYLDGDLQFDGSIADGGGRFFSGSTEILFETDSATGSNASTTFVGITGEGGTIPAAGRYEIDVFSGLRSRIIAGNALDDTVAGDGADADQFIDAGGGYDVTLALNNLFSLAAGSTTTYTTSTFFGSGAPEIVTPGVPEPTTVLFGLGLFGACLSRRARRATSAGC